MARNPYDETNDAVRQEIISSHEKISDLSNSYPAVTFSVRFYKHEPFFRSYTFRQRDHKKKHDKKIALIGMYYHDPNKTRGYVGAEDNDLVVCEGRSAFESRLLERCRSRFEDSWDRLKAVIFDLDGVVIDSMPFYVKAWQVALKSYGSVDEAEIYRREGEAKPLTAHDLYVAARGNQPSQEDIKKIVASVESTYKTVFHMKVVLGMKELLGELDRKGVKLALVTGSSRATYDAVSKKQPSLFRLFHQTVTGDETEPDKGKPQPDPYVLAVKKLNVRPDHCIVVENAPLGIRAACAAKLMCLAFHTASALPEAALHAAGAKLVCRNITELRRYLV